jgi:hypothetical protein
MILPAAQVVHAQAKGHDAGSRTLFVSYARQLNGTGN